MLSQRKLWIFLSNLDLVAAFDYPEEGPPNEPEKDVTHWCVRHEITGGDTEVVAEIFDSAAMTVREENTPREDDWECRRILSQLFAASPRMVEILCSVRDVLYTHCLYTHPSVQVVYRDVESIIKKAIDDLPELPGSEP